MARAHFGTVRKLPSGRWQARYTGPDDVRRTLGMTYDTKADARAALAAIELDIREQGPAWLPPGVDAKHDEQTRVDKFAKSIGMTKRPPTFGRFAREYLETKSITLAPKTVEGYESLLHRHLLPTFGQYPLNLITVRRVDEWWASMGEKPVLRRNAYFLLSGIMRSAVRYSLITASPCVVENAGAAVAKPRQHLPVEDFRLILTEIPEHLHDPLWVMFGAHLRIGELAGLNLGDWNPKTQVLTVERQAQETRGGLTLRPTKTGNRRAITPLQPALEAVQRATAGRTDGPDAPMFRGPKGGRLSAAYVRGKWDRARDVVGLPHAHLHDLRHSSLTLVAQHGATTKEVMNRAGHTTVAAAIGYQHATASRDAQIAAAVKF